MHSGNNSAIIMTLRWSCATLLLTVICGSALSTIITGPTDKVYERGVDTTGLVECVLSTSSSGQVFIIHNGRVIASGTGPLDSAKHTISDTASQTGNYSLVILNLSREDSGTYGCQFGGNTQEAQIIVAGM